MTRCDRYNLDECSATAVVHNILGGVRMLYDDSIPRPYLLALDPLNNLLYQPNNCALNVCVAQS